jgi:hypothetical protein
MRTSASNGLPISKGRARRVLWVIQTYIQPGASGHARQGLGSPCRFSFFRSTLHPLIQRRNLNIETFDLGEVHLAAMPLQRWHRRQRHRSAGKRFTGSFSCPPHFIFLQTASHSLAQSIARYARASQTHGPSLCEVAQASIATTHADCWLINARS